MIENRNIVILMMMTQLILTEGCAGITKSNTIQCKETAQNYEMQVPVSELYMIISKDNFPTKGSGEFGGGYFILKNDAENCMLSVWFDSANRFNGTEKKWQDYVEIIRRKGWPLPQDIQFQKIDGWDTVLYDDKLPKFTVSNIRANWIQAGTWIDLHLSMLVKSTSDESRAKLVGILKTIQVKEKPLN